MSIITKIEEQKNKSRVNIFVDETFFCGLNKEIAIIFRLKEGKEVNEEKLRRAVYESEVKTGFEKALNIISRQMQTEKKIREKLTQKGFSDESIDDVVTKLKEYHYIDDSLYAKQFVQQSKTKSRRVLKQKLLEKGVFKDIVEDVLQEERDEDETDICLVQARKYLKNKTIIDKKDLQKVYASLARKGFNFDTIKKAVKMAINKEIEEEEYFN